MSKTRTTATFLAILAIAEPAAANPLLALVHQYTQDRVCSIQDVRDFLARKQALTYDQRVRLYLRCEIKGGSDEFTSNSCCDHLTASDAEGLAVCPDRPPEIMVPAREALRATMDC